MHAMLKEYIKEEMKKGTYEEIPFQPLVLMSYDDDIAEEVMDMDSEMDMDDWFVCWSHNCVELEFSIDSQF